MAAKFSSGKSKLNLKSYPQRIVCLTEETTETLYLLGEQDRIVGVSAYTVRPTEAKEKKKVSAFVKANYKKILECEPDLVLAFSDLQAEISMELVKRGITVFTFNQRSIQEILEMIITLGRIVGAESTAFSLVEELQEQLNQVREQSTKLPFRPRVWFEEWDDPLIGGIQWVEELLEIAGAQLCFPGLGQGSSATERILKPNEIPPTDPQIIFASWCGKKVDIDAIRSRPGWEQISAIKTRDIIEIDPSIILQPGPAALTDGLQEIKKHVQKYCKKYS